MLMRVDQEIAKPPRISSWRSFWRELVTALAESRQKQADNEIARHIHLVDGPLRQELKRAIRLRHSTRRRNAVDAPSNSISR